jgi:hypothetical protein
VTALLPILIVAVMLAAMAWIDAAERRANRRWEDRQQAAAQERDPDRAAWDDIVRQLTREDRKP